MRLLTVTIALALVAAYAVALTETDDFPDVCDGYAVAEIGEGIQGSVDHEDKLDHIGLNVTASDVGDNVTVAFTSDTYHLDFSVYTPDCAQNVVPIPHKACEKAQCPKGHTSQAKGHTMCQGQGHIAECSGAANGVQDEDSVTFQPTQAGVFVIVISFDAKSFHSNNAGGGKDDPCRTNDCACINCDQICSEFCTASSGSSSGGASPSGSDGGATIQSCHWTCSSESVFYNIATDSDSTTFVS